ncbi:phosphomethylpyrimidine kinase [Ottowia sp. GY511]|uniref:hydroxymethylpyrimidine kinase n=1 Tax=Ottowia flava TaxID=2675430 RepID=A0ABW4KQV5_9BURK|nr:PfkB family carbohydrate kinase [Ottowia sp. GY511]TXK28281.1 phosphomethylpyrimidine kinase [Ottowia sp. GY511]
MALQPPAEAAIKKKEVSDYAKPIVWSIAGNDSGGGAGLAADQRAAEAFGVHLCPVVATITAQNSQAVTQVVPVAPEVLDAQLAALADDLPPTVIKTGLLGGPEQVAVVARWVDRLRERQPSVALVVDPVLRSSSGTAFAGEATLHAYRDLLLPRATLLTPNRREALRLAGLPDSTDAPALAAALQALGAASVCVTGGDEGAAQPTWSLDWVQTLLASGWLALPRVATPHTHGTGCTFASSAAAAMALGFVAPDALVLAKMATTHALRRGYAAGQGAGPVAAAAGFGADPSLTPCMGWGDDYDLDSCLRRWDKGQSRISSENADLGLYAIVDSAARVQRVLQAGVKTVQLRIKTPGDVDAPWFTGLETELQTALTACQAASATLVVNDHWRIAHALAQREPSAAPHLALHLGQEDLHTLGTAGRAELAATGLQLGISSHSLWELARARGLHPWYAACGPIWPTLTKDMPWVPQGLDNLAWWVQMAGAPVVAIGGILEHAQAEEAARSGAAGVCIVRGLGDDPAAQAPGWQAAIARGRAAARLPVPALPHPSLACAD